MGRRDVTCSRTGHASSSTSATPPPPVPARKTQCSGATFRRAVFLAKEVPGAQYLSPRAQTHLPFGCSVVGVMWKPKASLNLPKKISSLGLYMVPGQQYVRTCHWSSGYALVYRSASVGSIPSNGPPKFFCTFCHLALPPTEVFCTFCHLARIGIQSSPFFFHAETSLKEKWQQADKCTQVENCIKLHFTSQTSALSGKRLLISPLTIAYK